MRVAMVLLALAVGLSGCQPRKLGARDYDGLADSLYVLCESYYWKTGNRQVPESAILQALPHGAKAALSKGVTVQSLEIKQESTGETLLITFRFQPSMSSSEFSFDIVGKRGCMPGPVYEPKKTADGFLTHGPLTADRLNYADHVARRIAYASNDRAVLEWNSKREKDGFMEVKHLDDGSFEMFTDGQFIARYRYAEGVLRYESLSASLFR